MIQVRTMFAAVVALLYSAIVVPNADAQAAANPRIALVIGNATYRDQALATTANDAGLVAQTLQAAGFDVVGARDLDGQSLRTAFRDFLDKAAAVGPDMQAFVYLAGRGVQYNGDNYFVPVDAEIRRDADVPLQAVRIADFVHALATTPGRDRIVVLDAARANPYAAQGDPLAPGLALVDPEPGVLIAYNAAPGTLAGDEQGPYGVFGKTLAGAMRQGGVDIAQAFDQTRVLVNQETQGALLSWSASHLDGPYFIFERAPDAPPPPILSAAQTDRAPIASLPDTQAYAAAVQRDSIGGYREYLDAHPRSAQARRIRAILAVRREAAFWRRTLEANSPDAYWTYLRAYPKGPHVHDAGRRLAILSAQYEPPPDFAPMVFEDVPPPPPDEQFYEDRPIYAFDDFGPPPPPPPVYYAYEEDDEWRYLPPPPPPVIVGALPVLGVAIPLVVGAVAYQGLAHRDGLAPRDAPRFQPPPPAPPPIPANIKPVPPPAPRAAAVDVKPTTVVKPLPPLAAAPSPAGDQPGAKGSGRPPAAAAPQAPAANLKPETPKPLPAPLPQTGAAPAIAPTPPGGKPLPAPPPNPAPATLAKPEPGKPLPAPLPQTSAAPAIAPVAPGGKPLPAPPPNPAPATLAKPETGKPLPAPTQTGNAPAIAPATPGGKPLPAHPPNPAPAAIAKPESGKPLPAPPQKTGNAPPAPSGKPMPAPPNAAPVERKPPASLNSGATAPAVQPPPVAHQPPPVVRPPAPPNPALPPAAAVHPPAAPVAPPAAAVHAPALPPPAAVHVPAPPPIVHAPAVPPPAPPPAPVVRAPALPPPAAVVRPPPPAGPKPPQKLPGQQQPEG
jgi:uncharacterized caspase-like protein